MAVCASLPIWRSSGKAEERPRVALGISAPDSTSRLHVDRKLEQPEDVGDRSPVLPDQPGDLGLRERELLDQALVPLGLVHRGELVALQVLDQGEGQQGPVVDVLDHGRDLRQPSCCTARHRRSPAISS